MCLINVKLSYFIIISIYFVISFATEETGVEKTVEEQEYGVKYANDCEVCKYFTIELEDRLRETGKSHDVIETGYALDAQPKKRKKYTKSELRLLESLEGICDRLLTYNIHKERTDSTRFAKGQSTTFKVLNDLVDKGVKVELGIPHELWDKPSAEVTNLKTKCELLLEKHENDIEDWYFNYQEDVPLQKFLCVDKALHKGDTGCLDETSPLTTEQPPTTTKPKKKTNKKAKKDKREL